MSVALYRNIGAYIKSVVGIIAVDTVPATINGPAIDRSGHDSCVLQHQCGAASGSPTAQTADAKLQESADGSTGWTDITGAAAAQLVADDTSAEVDVDLSGTKQFIRVVEVVALTAGTTPALDVAASVILGPTRELPV